MPERTVGLRALLCAHNINTVLFKKTTYSVFIVLFCIGCEFTNHNGNAKYKAEIGNNAKMIDQIFHDVEANTSNLHRMVGFTVSVKSAQDQPISSGGISCKLDITYVGEEAISIHNPLYFLQISVMDEKGTLLQLKRKPPIPLIHRKTPINPDEDFVFAIMGISHNNKEANILDETNKSVVLFHKGFRYTYNVKIEKYLNPNTKNLENLPKGEYNLELMLSLVASDITDASEGTESRTLKITDLRISLKE
jgi:hypothetical protein